MKDQNEKNLKLDSELEDLIAIVRELNERYKEIQSAFLILKEGCAFISAKLYDVFVQLPIEDLVQIFNHCLERDGLFDVSSGEKIKEKVVKVSLEKRENKFVKLKGEISTGKEVVFFEVPEEFESEEFQKNGLKIFSGFLRLFNCYVNLRTIFSSYKNFAF